MSQQAKTAIFLGAGASCPFGFPATAGLLPRTLHGLADRTLFGGNINDLADEHDDMAFLFRSLQTLLPGWNQQFPGDKLPFITEVLSLVDYSLGEGKPLFPGQTHEEALRVRRLLERAIYEVLWKADHQNAQQKQLLETLRRWVESRCEAGCGVITTNYDTSLEQELFNQKTTQAEIARDFDFGFAWLDTGAATRTVWPRPAEPRLRWFKLHGSLNWARCPACEHLYLNPYGDIAHQAFRRATDDFNTCHCGSTARLHLHLVAPSMYRTVRDANLLEVWKNALQLLLEADEWILIGYSLPSEDIAIRSLLVRAFHARNHRDPPRVTVVQFGQEAEPRYKLLFPDCDYRDGGLAAWLQAL